MKNYTLISPCFFGMEKMLAREIKKVTNGQLRMLKENNKYFLEYLF